MTDLGKALILLGLAIALIGVGFVVAGRIPWLGRLPGDISVQRGHWAFYFPLATSLVVSAVLSLLLYLLGRR
jgi:membrane protein implicated in regulation of membrane protease activity